MSQLAKFESRILETSDRAPAQCRTIMLPTIRTYVEFRHFEELISNPSGSISLKLMEVKKPVQKRETTAVPKSANWALRKNVRPHLQ